jgi:hypothetical protein
MTIFFEATKNLGDGSRVFLREFPRHPNLANIANLGKLKIGSHCKSAGGSNSASTNSSASNSRKSSTRSPMPT